MSLISQIYAAGGSLGFNAPPTGMQITDISVFISKTISFAFIIAGILVFGFLVYGGIIWLTAGGDKTNTEKARTLITNAVIGLAIVATSYAVMKVLSFFFGINIVDGTIPIPKPY